jgi:hypothetical protein
MRQHLGPNYEIIEEREVVTGQSTTNNQQTNTEAVQNKRNPKLPGELQTTTSTTMQRDVTEWRIWYRRGVGQINHDQPYGGLPPIQQTGGVRPQGPGQGPAPGVMPSVLPGPQPGGPTSYYSPSMRPRVASATPACSA